MSASTTNYIVNNGNYTDKDLSEIFVPISPNPYMPLRIEEDFVYFLNSTVDGTWVKYGSNQEQTVAQAGTINNPGQVKLITTSDNGVSGIRANYLLSVNECIVKCVCKTTETVTNDGQSIYAGVTNNGEIGSTGTSTVYIGLPKTSTTTLIPELYGFVNNNPITGPLLTLQANNWYEFTIELSKSTPFMTFTVRNITTDVTATETVNTTSGFAYTSGAYYLFFEQRIDSSTKNFYVDYFSYVSSSPTRG